MPALSGAELIANEDFVRRLARTLANEEAEGEDLVQDAWLAALERRPERGAGLRAWLARVLRNRAALGLRRRERRLRREADCARPERQPDTTELVERVELHHKLVGAVLALPEAYREVVLCHCFRGDSVTAIARRLGAPEATVRTRLRRARESLREELRRSGVERGAFPAALLALGSQGIGPAHAHVARPLLELCGWSSNVIMKKTLLETPLIVSGVLGASLGFGSSFMLFHGSGAEQREPERGPDPALIHAAAPLEQGTREEPASARVALRDPVVRTAPDEETTRGAEGSGGPDQPDARSLLASRSRLDQIRGIELLVAAGTPEASALLLETLLACEDPLLAALLQEALLDSRWNVAPAIMDAFRTVRDPAKAGLLADMLASLAERQPALEAQVVELLAGALGEPGTDAARAGSLAGALARIGPGALEAVADVLAGAGASPEAVQSAAWVLTQLGSERADEVRDQLRATFSALFDAQRDPVLTDEERRAMLERTQTIAWAATRRPEEEHDRLAPMLLDALFHAPDDQQCQSLAWGLANLRGLSDAGRLSAAASIFAALPDQPDAALRQSYAWAVSNLARFDPDDPQDATFFAILERARENLDLYRNDARISAQLQWLLAELERQR